jgi:hypothetical protein
MQSIQEFLDSAFEGSDPSFPFSCCSLFVSVTPFSALKYEICLSKILRCNYHITENTTLKYVITSFQTPAAKQMRPAFL